MVLLMSADKALFAGEVLYMSDSFASGGKRHDNR